MNQDQQPGDEWAESMKGRVSVGGDSYQPLTPNNSKAQVVPRQQPGVSISDNAIAQFPQAETIIGEEAAGRIVDNLLPQSVGAAQQPAPSQAIDEVNLRSADPGVNASRVKVALEDAQARFKRARDSASAGLIQQEIANLMQQLEALKVDGQVPVAAHSPSSPFANLPKNNNLRGTPPDATTVTPVAPVAAAPQPTQATKAETEDDFGDLYTPDYSNDVGDDDDEPEEETQEQVTGAPDPESQAVPTPVAAAPEQGLSAKSLFDTSNDVPFKHRAAVPVPVPTNAAGRPTAATMVQRQMYGASPLNVPSKHASYPTKENIEVSRMMLGAVRDVIRASATQSIRALVKTLGTTLQNFDVFDATEPDFHYLMYWHRLNSYKKLPFVIPWTCTAHNHVERVKSGAAQPESLKNLTTVSSSIIDVRELDVDAFNAIRDEFKTEYDLELTLPTVRDMVTQVEQEGAAFDLYRNKFASLGAFNHLKDPKTGIVPEDALDKLLGDESEDETITALPNYKDIVAMKSRVLGEMTARNYSNQYASLLANNYGDLSVRWDIIQSLPPDAQILMDKMIRLASSYGVNEKWNVTCGECGASKAVIHRLDALTFLPEIY